MSICRVGITVYRLLRSNTRVTVVDDDDDDISLIAKYSSQLNVVEGRNELFS